MNHILRILLVAEGFAPDEMAGAGRWLFETARQLASQNHCVTVVVRRCRPRLPARETIENMEVFRYGSGRFTESALYGIRDIFEGITLLKRLFATNNFDLCHLFQPQSGFIALHAMKRVLPLFYTYFSPWHEEYLVNRRRTVPGFSPGYWFRYATERYVVNKCPTIIVLSDFSLGQVVRYHARGSRCVKIPGGVDGQRFVVANDKPALRQSLGIAPQTLLIFTLRNLRPRMGLFTLLDALQIIRQKLKDIHLIIGGDGPMAGELKQRISESGLSSMVTLAGKIADERLPGYYQAADLFVLPTERLEGFGLITLEALACGIPVAGTPVGATRELLAPFDQALLSKSEKPADLADTLERTIARVRGNGISASACRAYALAYSWEMVGKRVAQTYEYRLSKKNDAEKTA